MTRRHPHGTRTGEHAGPLADATRILVGVLFLVSSGVILVVTYSHPDYLHTVAQHSMFEVYADMILRFVVPYATAFSLFLVLYELAVGVCILSRGVLVKFGLLGAIVFLLLVVPAISSYAIPNLILAIILSLLLGREYTTTSFEVLRSARTKPDDDEEK